MGADSNPVWPESIDLVLPLWPWFVTRPCFEKKNRKIIENVGNSRKSPENAKKIQRNLRKF